VSLSVGEGAVTPPSLDAAGFAAVLARLADAGEPVTLPPAVEAGTAAVPLTVIERPDLLAAGLSLVPQFNRAVPLLRGAEASFRLSAPAAVELDLGDGQPARVVNPEEVVTARYPADLTEARLTVTAGSGRACAIRVGLDPTPAPVPDETIGLDGATLWVRHAAGHTALRCPLICVEGFPGGHGFAYSHDLLAQHGVLDALLARGFDLVVVGLEDGLRPLAENAAVVAATLAEIGPRTPLPATLVGWSMGGLLARLALGELERRGEPHQVSTLVTWDTPHRGAVTPLAVQWLLGHFSAAHPALAPAAAQLDAPANREMLLLGLADDGTIGLDPRRAELLGALTWPAGPRRVLVSSGRGSGGADLPPPGAVLAHWTTPAGDAIHLRAMGAQTAVGEGSWGSVQGPALWVQGHPALDGVPGSRGAYAAQAAGLLTALGGGEVHPVQAPATCQIPTVSALDLDQAFGAPVPDAPALIACQTDLPHCVIDAPAAARVLAQIGAPFDPARFDPHDPGFLADPFGVYELFRRYAPVSEVDGLAWVFGAADCAAALANAEVWVKQPPVRPQPGPGPSAALADLPPGLFSSDPPAHGVLRRAVESAFGAALAQAGGLAQTRAAALLTGLAGRGRIELVQDYALPLPAGVLFDLLGLPEDPVLSSVLIGWQQAIATAHDPTQAPMTRLQGMTCSMALRAYFDGLVHHGDTAPGLVGRLHDSFAAAGLGREPLIATLCDLLIAGYLSTTYLIANGLHRLLGQPGALARLREAPEELPGTVEELLRLEGPVQLIDRIAAVDTQLGGRTIAAGTPVALVVASANHDPVRFADPEALQAGREGGEHLAFGAGIHHCVGAPLARIVAPVALAALLHHAADIELDGEAQWQTDPYLRGAISLPLRVSL
jgi:cytochrome P450